jgi:hypothetical protein
MLEMNSDIKEALEESLYDLKHDLGKYIRLPVGMLPKEATWAEVAAQVEQAVLRTRKGPSGILSAAALFEQFKREWGARLANLSSYAALQTAVAAACALPEQILLNESALNRETVESILGEVSTAVQRLMDEVMHD